MTGRTAVRQDGLQDRVRAAVFEVRDPEIDVTLVDLGVLQEIEVTEEAVRVVLAPTRTACPGRTAMADGIRRAVAAVLPDAEVVIDWRPGGWRADLVSEQGLDTLRGCGYGVTGHGVVLGIRRCPYCGSGRVESTGRFGGSVCKTPFHCRACGSAFDELGTADDIG
ncbi:iron-sulfur cluster assembly protein [Kitasatospora sp. NPDC089509]|uniref:iron-sulfur cluster assembly protein n=1 Tax=Kitasatospora sp. NPDC089509 TaxID=3364079 RepID=UPI0037F9C7A6